MISDKFSVLRRFQFHEDAADLVEKLRAEGIQAEVIDNSPSFDVTFTQANPTLAQYEVKVHVKQFARAKEIQQSVARAEIKEIAAEHYLHGFSDQELIDLLKEEDQWNEYDVIAARLILTDRGVAIPEEEIHLAQEEIKEKQRQQIRLSRVTLIISYLLILPITIIPFALGCYVLTAKKSTGSGEQLYLYEETSRKHAQAFVGFSLIGFVYWIYQLLPVF